MRYPIVYADPPWRYRHCQSDTRKIENHYPTMSLEEIKALQVPAEKDSVLYLWTTTAKLVEAIEVMSAWGFDYRSSMVWDKKVDGMGFWFRGRHEFLLVCVKGQFSPPEESLRVSSILRVKRAAHSDKPDIVRTWLDRWYPDLYKLEMFARDHTPLFKREKWHMWGNEVRSDIDMGSVNNEEAV